MDKVFNVINWLVANNHLVAWIIAAITGAAYKTYRQRHNDNNVAKDFEFIADKAKTYAHVVNGDDNVPTNEVKPAIIKLTREAVDAYNANSKTRHINVTDQDISHATDVAIDYYNKNFGGFDEAKTTSVPEADIAQALQPESAAPTSVATAANTSVASEAPNSVSSTATSVASNSSAMPIDTNQIADIVRSQVDVQVKQALSDIYKGAK